MQQPLTQTFPGAQLRCSLRPRTLNRSTSNEISACETKLDQGEPHAALKYSPSAISRLNDSRRVLQAIIRVIGPFAHNPTNASMCLIMGEEQISKYQVISSICAPKASNACVTICNHTLVANFVAKQSRHLMLFWWHFSLVLVVR